MRENTHEGRVAVVSGAARGIGRAVAEGLASRGAEVLAVDVLDASETVEAIRTAGGRCRALDADVGAPADVARVAEDVGRCDVLVNNAALLGAIPFLELDHERFRETLRVNLESQFLLAKAFAPGMVERGWGRIVNLGSIGSFMAAPMTGAYGATKAYVLSLSLALTEELRGTGVTVTALCPGPTETGFQARAEMADSQLIAGRTLDSAEAVARAGYAAMKKGTPYLVTGTTSKLFAFGSRFLPRTMSARIAGRAQQKIPGA